MEKNNLLLRPIGIGILIFLVGFILDNILSLINLKPYDIGFIIGAYIIGHYYSNKSNKKMANSDRIKSAGFFAGIYLLISLLLLVSDGLLAKSWTIFTSGGGLFAILILVIIILLESAIVYFVFSYTSRNYQKMKNNKC